MRSWWLASCVLLFLVCSLGRMASACPAVALGGCAQTLVAAPAIVAMPVVAVPVVTTYAVPTIVVTPTVVQQQVIVRQRPVRVRSRTVIRSSSGGAFGLGIF